MTPAKATAPQYSPEQIIQFYLDQNFRVVMWPARDDDKGPKEKGWVNRTYGLKDWSQDKRVGILLGTEIREGHTLIDVDIDWSAGSLIAQRMIPPTGFVYGRKSKPISHCFYTVPEPVVTTQYIDPTDKQMLIELRGTKQDGTVGFQSMAPPSVWSKEGAKEPLTFVSLLPPTHLMTVGNIRQPVCLAAIGMLLARHLGKNGFGHEARLAWAGYLLRASIPIEDLIKLGEAMSEYCNNLEVDDVRRTVVSTEQALQSTNNKKVKGGPALAKILGKNGRAIIDAINSWLGRDSDFVRNDKGVIIARHQDNIRRAVTLTGRELSFNEFSGQLLMDGQQLENKTLRALYLQIEEEYRFSPPLEYFEMVVQDMAWKNAFHPVRDYLNSLTWDGITRLDSWLIDAAGAEDTPYVRAVSSIMLIAAVRRIREPGCKYDEMVVWESPQGADKSSAAAALCPNREWFSDDFPLNADSKQVIERTLGKWIIEASELSGKRKTEIEQLKAMMSKGTDGPARLAYERFPIERARHFILIGTTNSSTYLVDPTGNRRFWPIRVTEFNIAWIRSNRDALWAEACVREAAGESIRLPRELWPAAAEEQESRREIDPWEEKLAAVLRETDPSGDERRRIATAVLWDKLGIPMDRRDRRGALRISETMQRLGYTRGKVYYDGEVVVGYIQEKPERIEGAAAAFLPKERPETSF